MKKRRGGGVNISLEYFRFLAFREKVLDGLGMGNKECLLLRLITENAILENPIRITDALAHRRIGSPASLHVLIKTLIDKKLILVRQDRSDQRVKFLHPTARTLKMYQLLAEEFAQRRNAIC